MLLQLLLDGLLAVSVLTREDFEETAAEQSHTEGIIDGIRTVAVCIKVAALLREQQTDHGREFRVSSLYGRAPSTSPRWPISGAEADTVRAAGFTIQAGPEDEAVAALEKEIGARL